MTELDNITDFINSPAFNLMSENVKNETYAKQNELALALLVDKVKEHLNPIIEKYDLGIDVTFTEKKVVVDKPAPIKEQEPQPSVRKPYQRLNPATGLCVWLPDGSFIQELKAAATFSKAIHVAGVKKVMALNIMLDNHNIVVTHTNYPHPMQFNEIEPGYYANVHSNTASKARHLEKISKALKLNWKIEIVQ